MMFMLGLPALYLAVLGVMYEGLITSVPGPNGPISYITFLAPGIIGMQALTAGNIGGGMLWADRRWGMFEQILVKDINRSVTNMDGNQYRDTRIKELDDVFIEVMKG